MGPFSNIKLFSQRGFSLIEVMVGGAILAGVALAGATLFKNQKSAQSGIENDQALQTFHANLSKILNNRENCNATLKQAGGYGVPVLNAGGGNISSIYECDGCIKNINYDAQTTPVKATPYISEGDWIEATNNGVANAKRFWRIAPGGINWVGNISITGRAILRVTYQVNPDIRSKSVSRDIPLNLRFAAGGFKECIDPKESMANNLNNDICETMNPNSQNGAISEWDPVDQKCKLRGTAVAPLSNCPQNQIADGFDSVGMPICRSILSDVSVEDLESQGSQRCAPNTQARLVVQNGRVRVYCQ